jgi:hypothetical protein
VSSPEAVGPVRVNWCVNEAAETGDNCHKDFGGLRDNGESDWHTSFLLDDSYVPWTVEKDEAKKVVFSNAYADDDDFPNRLGRAGALFRPSAIAGDRYSVTATIEFAGLPNEEALQAAHDEQILESESANLQIRRSAKVAVVVEWPGRDASNMAALDWASLQDEFAKAGIVLDVDGRQKKKISDVISADEYRDLVVAHTQFSDGAAVTFDDGCVMGVPLPGQDTLSPGAYQSHLSEYIEEFWNRLKTPLSQLLCKKLRAEHASGFIILDFLPHRPVNILQNDGLGGEAKVVEENYLCPGFSTSQPGGFIALQGAPEDRKAHEALAHEIGHAFWLNHWQHADDAHPAEHDNANDNCIMSNLSEDCSRAHHALGKSQAHFCGKCNLKLRGWDIQALPESSTGLV